MDLLCNVYIGKVAILELRADILDINSKFGADFRKNCLILIKGDFHTFLTSSLLFLTSIPLCIAKN